MRTPILLNHDQSKPIGFAEVIDEQLHVHFSADMKITKELAFQIFGNAGWLKFSPGELPAVRRIAETILGRLRPL